MKLSYFFCGKKAVPDDRDLRQKSPASAGKTIPIAIGTARFPGGSLIVL